MIRTAVLMTALLATPAIADPASIESVRVAKVGGSYTFSVTVRHADTGWEDYADAWRVKDTQGNVLGERGLAHPHVDEQPFTRSLSGVNIPSGVGSVVIEVRDTVTGWAPTTKTVDLP